MKKVGILTMYYNSINYGGLLQAYALCHYINNIVDYHADQICFINNVESCSLSEKLKKARDTGVRKTIYKGIALTRTKSNRILTSLLLKEKLNKRANSIKNFRDAIPHTNKVFNNSTISEEDYDIYIVGSDRVWNPLNSNSAFFLDFVKTKTKLSYAASLTTNYLSADQKKNISKALKTYKSISVREENSAHIISTCTSRDVKWVCDPVMLLDKNHWEEISSKRMIDEDYVFCYFLGKDAINRRIVSDFAKRKGLKVVTIPFANNQICSSDIKFGDIRLYEASPIDFLSYLRYAKYVFTDSFHATVFSLIFNKEVFTLARKELKKSGSRIESITSLLGIEDHYCCSDKQQNLNYILSANRIDYDAVTNKMISFRELSKEYLESALRNE